MQLIQSAPSRTYDPLQSVLAHLPDGMYGAYEGLCNFMFVDPLVPMHVKEGLRFLSAVRIGCAYCQTVREQDKGGARLLAEEFYVQASSDEPDWSRVADRQWVPVFEMGVEVLDRGTISAETMDRMRANLTDPQIVEAVFFMLVIGASHRFSRAFSIEESCPVPATLVTSTGTE